jgi:asparagine N-glycosylation enzyme membrane subunit Stt3
MGDGFKQVRLAVILLWIVLGLGAVNSFILSYLMPPVLPPNTNLSMSTFHTFTIIGTIFGLGIQAWLIIKIAGGRNWARIVFLILFILGLFFVVSFDTKLVANNFIAGGIAILGLVLQSTAAILIFTNPGRQWFIQRR